MDASLEMLDTKLRTWNPATAAQVREPVAEVIELADQDVLNLMRSRVSEQEVLDLLVSPQPGDVRLIASEHAGDAPHYRAKGLRR